MDCRGVDGVDGFGVFGVDALDLWGGFDRG